MSLESISTDKLINGIKKAYENAESFLNDVYILKEYEGWAHAYTLCQFAIEELSKIPMLFQIWINRINENKIDYEKLDSDFRNHIVKTEISILFEMQFFRLYKEQTGAEWVDDAIKKGEEFLQNIKQSNDLKNEGLYVTVKNNDFQSPTDIITKEIFDSIYGKALLRKMMFENLMKGSEKYINEIAKLQKEEIDKNEDENKSN
jgi:AbiV family abortive infection protein